jgi:hypothetical protein
MEFVTINTIVFDLLNIIRGASIVQSEPISAIMVEGWVHQYRAKLLKQDLDKGKMPNPDYIQEIPHVGLSPIDLSGDEGGVATGDYRLRSDLQIPNSVDLNFKSGLTYVGTVFGEEIQLVPEGRSRYQKYKKYTPKEGVAFLRGRYLYVENEQPLEFVSIRGIFENPAEVGRFVNPETDQPYFNEDSVYPIPMSMVPTLKEMILKQELNITLETKSDDKTDSAHSVKE